MFPQNSTNLKNRVNKINLSTKKSLYPLFEVISNSIHAIQELKEINQDLKPKIHITAIRRGNEETLSEMTDIETSPIVSFKIEDNGIGLDSDNMKSFTEFDSIKKSEIGGKGVGRLVCLKAFKRLEIESIYKEKEILKLRKFHYTKSEISYEKYEDDLDTNETETGTKVLLFNFEEKYEKQTSKSIREIARQIITHFQLYFIQKIEPEIIISNQYGININLTEIYNDEFEKKVLEDNFTISNKNFNIYISKSYNAQSHRIHYCAHERTVKDEGLYHYLVDLKNKITNDGNYSYFFQVFIVGEHLNKNVNEARTSFNFATEDAEDEEEITLAKIRKNAIFCIEKLLSDFLKIVRKEKLDKYFPIIQEEYPNYQSVVNYNREKVEKIPAGLSKRELDLKLYEIESEWRLEVKTKGIKIIDKDKDITELDNYKELYDSFLTEFNEIGQSDLTRYVIHRKSVIELLDKLIELNEINKFANEDIIHSLFFPIKETGKTVPTENQNLWLIDERLTYNSLIASDKTFNQTKELDSSSAKRTDLIIKKEDIYENATLFSEDKIPFESFTIVEFKKPERDDYVHGNYKTDPVKQVRTYIKEIINGDKKIKGKKANLSKSVPFYCYIIADITDTLLEVLKEEIFKPTPDGMGYFRLYDTDTYIAYIEVIPFKKIVKDSKQRNKVLFDKLKLSI